jgi:hypothetical protein
MSSIYIYIYISIADSQIASLEAQLELANRQLKESTHDGEFRRPATFTVATPRDVTHTVTKMKKETTFDARNGEFSRKKKKAAGPYLKCRLH